MPKNRPNLHNWPMVFADLHDLKKMGSTIQKNGFHDPKKRVPLESASIWSLTRTTDDFPTGKEIHVSTGMGFPNLSILIVTGLPPWARWLGLNFCCQQPSAGEIISSTGYEWNNPYKRWFSIRSVNFGKSYGLKYWGDEIYFNQ